MRKAPSFNTTSSARARGMVPWYQAWLLSSLASWLSSHSSSLFSSPASGAWLAASFSRSSDCKKKRKKKSDGLVLHYNPPIVLLSTNLLYQISLQNLLVIVYGLYRLYISKPIPKERKYLRRCTVDSLLYPMWPSNYTTAKHLMTSEAAWKQIWSLQHARDSTKTPHSSFTLSEQKCPDTRL